MGVVLNNGEINGSQVAGNNIVVGINKSSGNNKNFFKQPSFWVGFISGIITSVIGSFLYDLFTKG